jgi:threonine/homoserine/homoserine lactone efflux protein
MTPEVLAALASFCFVSSITPGPNNMMLLSSGATFGLRRTVPHMLGISGGCVAMVLILGWGLVAIAPRVPGFWTALHLVSVAYLLWLAWRIATSTGPHAAGAHDEPLGLVGAAAFQWVNPKAWAMVLGAVASFARPDHLLIDVPIVALALAVIGFPCITLWAGSGSMLRNWLARADVLRAFNWGMAALLVASILPGLLHEAGRLFPTS